MFTVSVNTEEFTQTWVHVRAAVRVGMRKAVSQGVAEGAQEAKTAHRFKNQTGALEASIVGRVTGNRTSVGASRGTNVPGSRSSRTSLDPNDGAHFGEVKASAAYASYVEEGTRPHVIEPRRATMLSWMGIGGLVFARRVQHPGTRPYGYMAQAYLKCERVMVREIESGVAEAQKILDR